MRPGGTAAIQKQRLEYVRARCAGQGGWQGVVSKRVNIFVNGVAARPCGTALRHGLAALRRGVAARRCGAALRRGVALQHCGAAWRCGTALWGGVAPWRCCTVLRHGVAPWRCATALRRGAATLALRRGGKPARAVCARRAGREAFGQRVNIFVNGVAVRQLRGGVAARHCVTELRHGVA